jgi:DNA gyrase subunit A
MSNIGKTCLKLLNVSIMALHKVSVDSELRNDYLLYSCSIFNRALPSVVDGLKTAQRRIILGIADLVLRPSGQFKKVSRLEGHVLGLYHPQGSCAGTAINMGQADTFRYPLTDIHGNAGGSIQVGAALGKTISNDPPAAARYLEIKSAALSQEVYIDQLDKYSHDWVDNYDATTQEVQFFIPKIPMLLVNGGVGIAAGYACNHISYNLIEVCSAASAIIKDPAISFESLSKIIKGPDLPQGARIVMDNLVDSLESGSGGMDVYGSWIFKEVSYGKKATRPAIIIKELAVGSAESFLEKVKSGVESEKITDIADISDYSSKDGIEIEVVLKKGGDQNLVLSQLLKYTNLYSRININAVAMKGVLPQRVGVKDIILSWYEARQDCLKKKFLHELSKNLNRLEILEGLLIISDNIDEAIKLIRASKDKTAAAISLKKKYNLSDLQVGAVLSMTLSQLVKTEKTSLLSEKKSLLQRNKELNKLIKSKSDLDNFILLELDDVVRTFGDERRTKILKSKPVAVSSAVAAAKVIKKTAASKSSSTLTTKDLIKKEARELGVTRKLLSEFYAQAAASGKSIKSSWEDYKVHYIEFISPKGKRERRAELERIKAAAYSAGMSRRGKNSWTQWIISYEKKPLSVIRADLKKLLGRKLKI